MRPAPHCGQHQHAAGAADNPAATKPLFHWNKSKYSRYGKRSKFNWTGQVVGGCNTCTRLKREAPSQPAETVAPAVPLTLQELVGSRLLLGIGDLLLRLARGPPRQHPTISPPRQSFT